MKKNGYSAVELLIVIVLLGVITLGVVISTSNAFKDDAGEIYEETTYLILRQAELYGKNSSTLEQEGVQIITVRYLVESKYYVSVNQEGNVVDPRNSKATLNGLKIKLVKEGEEVKASLLEES